MTPRRVLYVEACEDGTIGGSHQILFDQVRHLDRARFTPVVLFYQQNSFVERLRNIGVEVHVWERERQRERAPHMRNDRFGKLWSMIGAVVRRALFLRRAQIDLAHLNNSPALGHDDWLPAGFLTGVPCVVSGMGAYSNPPTKRLAHWLTTKWHGVIAISRSVADNLRLGGVPERRTRIIHPGIEIEAFRARVRRSPVDVRQELHVADDCALVAMVGHFRKWKGQDVVLAALQQLDESLRQRLRVIFVGGVAPPGAAYYASLHETVARASLGSCVTFLGERADVPDLMNAADIVLHASTIPEPFGIVVLEGMALGRAVIASNIGGPAEILDDQSGVMFDPTRPEELAARLAELARAPERRAALGAAALRRVAAFDAAQQMQLIEALYAELLGLDSATPRVGQAQLAVSVGRA
jgi:glycosyltransferase involved in cell wall biosynthesis